MSCVNTLPLLLSILVVLLIGLVTWGFFRSRKQMAGNALIGARDDMLLGLLVLAAFASGVFSTIILLTFVR